MRARHVGLLAAGGVGAWTLGWRLDAHHLRGDELYYRQAALDMLEGQWLTNAQHPPLAKQLMALTHLGLGDTVVADRLPAALAAWVTGLLLALLVWQVGRPGRWTALVGIATALLWWTLPWAPGRTATLESVMTCGLLAAQLAWTLAVTRRDPRWLLVGGALAGLAAAAKLTGALALVGLLPAALLLLRHRPAHTVVPLAAAALVAAGVTWVFPFVPMEGEALRAMTTPVTFQLGHAEAGHTVVVAGQTHHHAPWWTSLWFALQRLGPLAAAGLVLGALVGLARHGARLAPVATTLLGLVVAMSLSPCSSATTSTSGGRCSSRSRCVRWRRATGPPGVDPPGGGPGPWRRAGPRSPCCPPSSSPLTTSAPWPAPSPAGSPSPPTCSRARCPTGRRSRSGPTPGRRRWRCPAVG